MSTRKLIITFIAGFPFGSNEDCILFNFGRMLNHHFDLVLVGPKGKIPERLQNYFKIYAVDVSQKDFLSLLYYSRVVKAIKRLNTDLVVNVCKPKTAGFAAIKSARKLGSKSVVRMTGDPFVGKQIKKGVWRLKSSLVSTWLIWFVYRRADHILAISPRLKEGLRARGVPESQVSVLMQPFDSWRFSPPTSAQRIECIAKKGFSEEALNILFVGNLVWSKGADRLREIVQNANDRNLPFLFWIVGYGPYYEEFKNLSNKLVNIKVLGKVPHQEIKAYYYGADVLGFLSRSEGGVPNVILEALGTGLQVVSYPVADVSDWTPYIVNTPKEFLDLCCNYFDNFKNTSLQNVHYSRLLNWENQKSNYVAFFNQILHSKMPTQLGNS